MRITSLSISHFRGINSGKLWFPLDQRLICIIGSGDSCKSTVLKAIEWAMWPTWNLTATDTDFYKSNTSEPIVIEASIAEIPDNLLSDDKFGLYLRDAEAVYKGEDNDEPVDDKTFVITIRLTIDASLEPKWEVISNRLEPKYISPKERQTLSCGIVGYDYEKDFVWGRNSILKKYTDSKDTLHSAYTKAMREAISKANLKELDSTSETLISIGKQYGVSFSGDVSNKILMQNGSSSTMAGVFDGEVPFVLRGLGSRRLLSMGMNINLYDGNSMLLIDEIETGLEPYRICGLINEFRKVHQSNGQIIMTTHSQNVVTECNVGELMVIESHNGEVKLHSLKTEDSGTNDSISSLIRTDPSAFL
ncbi:ATP-binding protein [Clostridiaceae bacterium HFYG-1003]|nr:ATP-binding protein [Clostridiaceae bacterium HFYG-1003]